MALRGDFIYIPKPLASWRQHGGGISVDRYKSINEVMRWADEYFSQSGLPKLVKNAEVKCRNSIDRHCASLIENSGTEKIITHFVASLNHKYQSLIEKHEEMKYTDRMLKKDVHQLTIQIEELVKQNGELIAHMTALEKSKSWQITKPLRGLTSLMKGIFKI